MNIQEIVTNMVVNQVADNAVIQHENISGIVESSINQVMMYKDIELLSMDKLSALVADVIKRVALHKFTARSIELSDNLLELCDRLRDGIIAHSDSYTIKLLKAIEGYKLEKSVIDSKLSIIRNY